MPDKNGINVNIKINLNGLAKAVLIYCGYKLIVKTTIKEKRKSLFDYCNDFFGRRYQDEERSN